MMQGGRRGRCHRLLTVCISSGFRPRIDSGKSASADTEYTVAFLTYFAFLHTMRAAGFGWAGRLASKILSGISLCACHAPASVGDQ